MEKQQMNGYWEFGSHKGIIVTKLSKVRFGNKINSRMYDNGCEFSRQMGE
jgi:hypothetical protein